MGAILSGLGCASPLSSGKGEPSLEEALRRAIAQELRELPEPFAEQTSTAPAAEPALGIPAAPKDEVLSALASRRAELDAIGPLSTASTPRYDMGTDLVGRPQGGISLTLDAAIASAVNRNLGLRATRLQPGISNEEVLAAEAEFDFLAFGNIDLNRIDEPQLAPVLNGVALGTRFSNSDEYRFETGVRKRWATGTQATLSTDLSRYQNNAGGISFSPDPAYTAAVRLGLTQPLLRGFGRDANEAVIRLARNDRDRSEQQVRSDLLSLVADTEHAYWNLVQAWGDLAIAEWLVDVGREVRDVLARRRAIDTRSAQYADAVATVEQRQADVIRARRRVRAASDALKALMNDQAVPLSSEALLRPADDATEAAVVFDLRETILAAIDRRPEIDQAALGIADADIRRRAADNDALPLLNLNAQLAWFGQDDAADGAYRQVDRGDFIDYLFGLAFEYPLGNRAAEARARQERLRRSAAALNYQRTVQQVILEVKAALRDVASDRELIAATRSFRVAQAENLRALRVQEETLASLTPEFLNLKFQRQESLAGARRQEIAAVVSFGKSLASLHRAMGTGLTMHKINVEIIDQPAAEDLPWASKNDGAHP